MTEKLYIAAVVMTRVNTGLTVNAGELATRAEVQTRLVVITRVESDEALVLAECLVEAVKLFPLTDRWQVSTTLTLPVEADKIDYVFTAQNNITGLEPMINRPGDDGSTTTDDV